MTALPCSVVQLNVYERDGITPRSPGTVQVKAGMSWSDLLGGGGSANLSAPLLQSALVTLPTMLENSVVKIALDLTGDPLTLTEIPFGFLGEGGEWSLVGADEDAGKDRALQCRSLFGLLDDIILQPESGWQAFSGDDRAFGWMSRITAHSFDESQWDGTIHATKYKDVGSGADRYHKPKHWPDKNAAWVNAGSKDKQYFRCRLLLGEDTPVKIFYSSDENGRVYVDSELKIKSNSDETGYTKKHHWSGVLGPGVHTIAFRFLHIYETFGSWGLITDYSDVDKAILTVMTVNEFGAVKKVLRRTSSNTSVWLCCQRDDGDDPPSWTAAGIVLQCFSEARDRGVDASQDITVNFDKTDDTSSVAWADQHEKSWAVGTRLSQIVTDLGEHGGFDPDLIAHSVDGLRLNAYKNQGSDVSGTVALTVGVNVLSYRIATQPIVANSLLVRSANRYQLREDLTSMAIDGAGRREGFLKLGKALSRLQARRRADHALENFGYEQQTHTAEIIATTGCVPYLDFGKGDTIMGYDREGSPTPVRVLSISGSVQDSGPVRFTLEMQTP